MSGVAGPVDEPVVTVVVIVYNDAARLPTAIRSVLDQSLRGVEIVVVDDASTDGSARVARRIAARHPDRVRVIELERNSGGCSTPRNTGIENALGAYVMFLDSDDTIERHACALLYARARETGADFVSGRCVRVQVDDSGSESQWCPKLFEEPGVYDAVRDDPDLLNDTLSTNKMYRRDFLDRVSLRFAEGVHYEDLLFSAQAYLEAGRIATIPDRVYNWTIVRRNTKKSITGRRAELQNFIDRVEVHRRVDQFLLSRGAWDLKAHKDAKFINHDLQLYVSDLRLRGAEYRREFLAVAQRYLAELDPSAFEECKPVHGIMAYLLLVGDTERAIVASDFAGRKGRRGRLLTDLVREDGRVYWCGEYLDTDLGRAQLDVTDLGLHHVPLEEIELGNELRLMALTDGRVHLAGEVVNPLGRIGERGLTGALELFDMRHRHRNVRIPVDVCHGPKRIAWSIDADVTGLVRPFGIIDPSWGLRLWLDSGDQRIATRVTADRQYAGAELPARPRIGRGVGDHFETRLTEGGLLGLRVVARGMVSRTTTGVGRRVVGTRTGRRLFTGIVAAERRLMALLRPSRGGTPPTPRAERSAPDVPARAEPHGAATSTVRL